ncbi:MAG: hypothetical protein JOY51_09690 [Nevskia sp.]|nr:hypothetical protein [Nevskia sp.]
MRPLSLAMMGLAAVLLAAPVWAQSKPEAAPKASPVADQGAGTTLIIDRESPIGLYLTPWKNEYASRNMDRPAQIVQEQMAPIDPQVFKRQNTYYDTIQAYRQAELGGKK